MDNSEPQNTRLRKIRPASDSASREQSLPSISESLGHIYFRPIQPRASDQLVPPIPKLINPREARLSVDGVPCQEYWICKKPYIMQQPPNEGVATFTRQTIGGKNLSYRLKVVQQPEKARACGSGPRCKS